MKELKLPPEPDMRALPISWAGSRFDRVMRFKMTTWKSIVEVLSKPKTVGKESFDEYLGWGREQQLNAKDCGYYIIGEFSGHIRHNVEFKRRATITLDIDEPGKNFRERLEAVFGEYEYFWHTSRKHHPKKPRIRVHLPLQRDVTSGDEYVALARYFASLYDEAMLSIDRVSFVPAQMMFFPSRSKDGVFEFGRHRGQWVDPDTVLAMAYIDWSDRREWPRSSTEVPPETQVMKADSPLTKPGIIGAFCRAYSVTRVLEEVIPGVYEPTDVDGRWRYHLAEGGGGAIVYDEDTALYSHHTNHDPCGGRSTNAFDLVRVHKFGELDKDVDEGMRPTELPSFVAVQAYAMTLPEVVEELDATAQLSDDEGAVEGVTVPAVAGDDDAGMDDAGAGDDLLDDNSSRVADKEVVGLDGKLNSAAVARARVRAMIAEETEADSLLVEVLPAIAGLSTTASFEAALLVEVQDRYKELTSRRIDMRSLRKTIDDVKRKLRTSGAAAKDEDELGYDVTSLVERDEETGLPSNTVANMATWLREGHAGYRVAYDTFIDDNMMSPLERTEWRPMTKTDVIGCRIAMERAGFRTFGGGNELVKMALHTVGRENAFDSAQLWLSSQIWDGVPRVESFFVRYFGAKDSLYIRAVGRYWWMALAGRVMRPGVKADMMPIVYGAQGMRKSTSVEAMAPAREFFTEFAYKRDDKDQGRALVGKLVAEWNELKGMNTADEDGIKTFIPRRVDEWVPKYEEKSRPMPRRVMFFGTTDKPEFLTDIAGNRRFLPVTAGRVDVDSIVRDREQLYAEGLELFTAAGGVVDHTAETLAADAHARHMIGDAWDDQIEAWLNMPAGVAEEFLPEGADDDGLTPKNGEGVVRISDVLQQAIGMPLARVGRAEEMRVAKILRRLGYAKFDGRREGAKVKGWCRVEPGTDILPG